MSDQDSNSGGLTLLASAITGRSTPVVLIDGTVTYTDGEVIFAGREAGADAVVVQASMLVAGSFDDGMAGLIGRRGSRSRYMTLEAQRAAGLVADVAPRAVLRRVEGLFDGSPSVSAQESLDRCSSSRIPEAPAWCGEIRPARLLRTRVTDSADISDAAAAKALEGSDLEELEDDDADDADRSRMLNLISAPISSPMAAKLARMLGMGGAPKAGDGDGGDDNAMSSNRQGRGLPGARAAAAPSTTGGTQAAALPTGWTYPEWSVDRNAYRPDWCTIAAFDPPVTATTEPIAQEPDVGLRRHLARLGLADESHRRQAEGDGLDVTALVDFACDRRIGRSGAPRVYEQRRSTGHDLGVLVLLDASGSTGESTDGNQIFAGERHLAARLTAELEALGNRVGTYAFYSRGKDNVRFLRVKTFDEQYGYAARRRLAAIEPTGFTRLGAAIRHGAHVLREQAGTSKLLLVVVGDGLPYEDGYEHRYAYEDTRKALEETVSSGVGCACVAMRSPTSPDVIDRVWGHVAHCHVDHPQDLAGEIRPLLRRALKDAAAQRRLVTTQEVAA